VNQDIKSKSDLEPGQSKRYDAQLKGDKFPELFPELTIQDYFDILLDKKGMKKSSVIKRANISREYGYQLMAGSRRGKRDYYICIALAMNLDLSETNRLLALTGCGALYSTVKRDAAAMFAINHGYDLDKTYDFFCELNLPPLATGLDEV